LQLTSPGRQCQRLCLNANRCLGDDEGSGSAVDDRGGAGEDDAGSEEGLGNCRGWDRLQRRSSGADDGYSESTSKVSVSDSLNGGFYEDNASVSMRSAVVRESSPVETTVVGAAAAVAVKTSVTVAVAVLEGPDTDAVIVTAWAGRVETMVSVPGH
jgi:hypothetical protein